MKNNIGRKGFLQSVAVAVSTLALKTHIQTHAYVSDNINSNENLESILRLVYPVGSIYMTTNNVNPEKWIPNTTWVSWGAGRVPVGVKESDDDFNDVEKIGGAKEHEYTPEGDVEGHTLSIDEIPSHNHGGATAAMNQNQSHSHNTGVTLGWPATANTGAEWDAQFYNDDTHWPYSNWINGTGATNIDHTHNIKSEGGDKAHTHDFTGKESKQSHIQPYITCYMWKRTK